MLEGIKNKYKNLSGEQYKDALFAATHEGISVATTQRSMEGQGWSLTKGEEGINVYEKPDGSKVTMKLDGNKVKSVDYSAPDKKIAKESVSANQMNKDLSGNFWSRPEDFQDDIKSRGWDVEEMNGEYAVISNNKGSQWEVRFDDHADYGDLTVKTFKPLMIDEEDDDEDITDAAPCRKLTGDTKIKVRK